MFNKDFFIFIWKLNKILFHLILLFNFLLTSHICCLQILLSRKESTWFWLRVSIKQISSISSSSFITNLFLKWNIFVSKAILPNGYCIIPFWQLKTLAITRNNLPKILTCSLNKDFFSIEIFLFTMQSLLGIWHNLALV